MSILQQTQPCPTCKGTGEENHTPCETCGGAGAVMDARLVEIIKKHNPTISRREMAVMAEEIIELNEKKVQESYNRGLADAKKETKEEAKV